MKAGSAARSAGGAPSRRARRRARISPERSGRRKLGAMGLASSQFATPPAIRIAAAEGGVMEMIGARKGLMSRADGWRELHPRFRSRWARSRLARSRDARTDAARLRLPPAEAPRAADARRPRAPL